MIEYKGIVNGYVEHIVLRVEDGVERSLPLRLDIRHHSPDGFSWGYSGSGPSQLALALLADCCDKETALKYYMEFRDKIIRPLSIHDGFVLTQNKVTGFIVDKLLYEKDQLKD